MIITPGFYNKEFQMMYETKIMLKGLMNKEKFLWLLAWTVINYGRYVGY